MIASRRWLGLGAIALAACSARSDAVVGRAQSALGGATYAYDANGLRAGGAPLAADALGRATTHDGATLAWGPDGALAAVVDATGARTEAITDETGRRIAWRKDGAITAADVDGVRLTPGHVEERVKVGDRVVGELRDGAFVLASTDLRGTPADDDASPAGPYGERASAPAIAPLVDYAGGALDPALGTVVMGVRDYDPRAGAFLAPDPKYLEHPDACVASPIECNLYGYARAQPADFVDPSGRDATPASDATSGAYSSKGGDPSSVGGLCWDKLPAPREVEKQSPGWASTHEGIAYRQTYLNRVMDAAAAGRARAMENAEQPRMSQCDDCYLADGKPNPARMESPWDRMNRELSLISKAGPFGAMLMTETLEVSILYGRQPSMQLLMPALTITSVMDASVNHMGVDTYGELQQYDIDDLKLHMELTRNKR